MIFIENLTENFDENFNESFIDFYFDFAAENYHSSIDQNSYNVVESYFFLSFKQIFSLFKICHNLSAWVTACCIIEYSQSY